MVEVLWRGPKGLGLLGLGSWSSKNNEFLVDRGMQVNLVGLIALSILWIVRTLNQCICQIFLPA